jgi:hypothetical protein
MPATRLSRSIVRGHGVNIVVDGVTLTAYAGENLAAAADGERCAVPTPQPSQCWAAPDGRAGVIQATPSIRRLRLKSCTPCSCRSSCANVAADGSSAAVDTVSTLAGSPTRRPRDTMNSSSARSVSSYKGDAMFSWTSSTILVAQMVGPTRRSFRCSRSFSETVHNKLHPASRLSHWPPRDITEHAAFLPKRCTRSKVRVIGAKGRPIEGKSSDPQPLRQRLHQAICSVSLGLCHSVCRGLFMKLLHDFQEPGRPFCNDRRSNYDLSRRAASRFLANSSPRLARSTAHRKSAGMASCHSPI